MSKFNKKIGFIGAGNMGKAFVGALIRTDIFSPSMIYISDINEKQLSILNKTYGVSVMKDNFQVFSACEIVIIAIKPQHIYQVLSQIAKHEVYQIPKRKIVISIAAGIPLLKIEELLYNSLNNEVKKSMPIIRVMPNTPALVLAGMFGISANKYAKPEDIKTIKIILESMGKVIEFKEEDMDAVTALSGSGPAYIFYIIEAMIEGGIKVGLEAEQAAILTLTTIKGALKLIEESNELPEILRRKVISPGGTTEAAFKILEKNRVKHNIIEAIAAATRRSKELSQLNSNLS